MSRGRVDEFVGKLDVRGQHDEAALLREGEDRCVRLAAQAFVADILRFMPLRAKGRR